MIYVLPSFYACGVVWYSEIACRAFNASVGVRLLARFCWPIFVAVMATIYLVTGWGGPGRRR